MDTQTGIADRPVAQVAKRVLNAGSGPYSPKKLHAVFQGWDEVRLDIDPRAKPHLVSSITDMKAVIPEPAYDAIWCSHNIEHLYAHEVKPAFLEFRRVLKPGGFALITCPDIEAVAKLIVSGKFETPAYMSPAGPVAALDMVYGYSALDRAVQRLHGSQYGLHRRAAGKPPRRQRLSRGLDDQGKDLRPLGGRTDARGRRTLHPAIAPGLRFELRAVRRRVRRGHLGR